MGKCLLVKPHTMNGRTTAKINGTGMGSVLLNGSQGVAGTYTTASPNIQTVSSGNGLGNAISAKLDKLKLQTKKKPSNIKFSI